MSSRFSDRASEERILQELLDQLDDPEATERKQRRLQRLLLTSGQAGVVLSFLLAMSGNHGFIAALLAAVSGVVAGMALLLRTMHSQWPVTRQYINTDAVKARLAFIQDRD